MEQSALKENRKIFSRIGFRFLIGTLIILVGQNLGDVIVLQFFPDLLEKFDLYFSCRMLFMYLVAFPVMGLMLRKIPRETFIEKKKMSTGQWICAFFISYAVMYLCNFVGLGITTLIGFIKQGSVQNVLGEVAMALHPAVTFALVVVCAPVAEELLFRKLLIDRVAGYGQGVAVVLSGVMFAFFHGNLNQFIYAFALGALLAFIYVKTGKLFYVISLHMAINFMGTFVTYLVTVYTGTVGQGIYGICIILMILAGAILLLINRKKFKLEKGMVQIPKGERFKTVILNPGVCTYCVLWLILIVIQLLV